jgi:hypothetical protein
MKKIELIQKEHNIKVGDKCPTITPNVTEDCLLFANNEVIGFYIRNIGDYSEKALKLVELANKELRSKNVPKNVLNSRLLTDGYDKTTGKGKYLYNTKQYSTILGGISPKPHMRRPYLTISSVHSVKTAQTFIKAMIGLAVESENIIKKIAPELYNRQLEIFKNVIPEYKFGNLFTSSISNFNINADYHKDIANIENTVNVIITKRLNSTGGNLNVPDYGATIDQCNNSMLVYPAWRNIHGVTPIIPTFEGGYRNSLVFYPLRAFLNKE